MRHSEVQACMADYLEGDLPLQKRALFDAHLDTCEQCTRDLRELRATISLLRGLPDPEPPPDLVGSVMRRLRAGEGRPTVGDRIREWLSSLADPGFAIPAAAIVAGLALLFVRVDLSQLGLGFPSSSRIAATQPVELKMRPARTPEPSAVERRMASNVSHSSPAAQVPRGSAVSQPQVVTDSSAPSPPDQSGTRTLVRLRIPLNRPAGGSAPVGNRSGSPQAFPPGVLVGVSSVPEASGAEGLVPGEGAAMGFVDRTTSPADPAFGGSGPAREEWDRAEGRRRELDTRLDFLLRDPRAFAGEFGKLSAAEQDLWLRAIAEHAMDSQVADRAVAVLRATGDPGALALAEAFGAAFRSLRESAWQPSSSASSESASGDTPSQ